MTERVVRAAFVAVAGDIEGPTTAAAEVVGMAVAVGGMVLVVAAFVAVTVVWSPGLQAGEPASSCQRWRAVDQIWNPCRS